MHIYKLRPKRYRASLKNPALQVYAAPLQDGSRAVALFNRHMNLDDNFPDQNLTVYWAALASHPM